MNRDEIIRIFRDPPILETDRLILRKMLKKDAADMYDYARRMEVTEYLLWEPHASQMYTYKYLSYLQSRYRAGDFYDWAIVAKRNDRMIGTCGFTKLNVESNSAEIGYVLNPDFWGMGIAPEAAVTIMRYGFINLRLHRIEAKYMIGNDKSRRVMEKIGMQFEGVSRDSMHVKGRYVSIGTCAILRGEFMRLYHVMG